MAFGLAPYGVTPYGVAPSQPKKGARLLSLAAVVAPPTHAMLRAVLRGMPILRRSAALIYVVQSFTDPITFTIAPVVTNTFTPQQYGSPGPTATLAEATVDQSPYIGQALLAAAAAAESSGAPAYVYLSPGYWFRDTSVSGDWLTPNENGNWGGLGVGSNVVLYGEDGTYCTWSGSTWGYPMFGTYGTGATIHDITFIAPTDGGSTAIFVWGTSPHLYNLDYQLGATQNSNSAATYALLEDLTVDGTVPVATLAAAVVQGTTYTTLSVDALPAALPSGWLLYLTVYGTGSTRAEVLQGITAQRVVVASAAAAGDTAVAVQPFTADFDAPAGTTLRQIVTSTNIALAGDYPNYTTVAPAPNTSTWNYQCVIRNCVSVMANAANIFIDTGYQSTLENCFGYVGHDMNFDFEYCVQCVMKNNVARYGGNRGCAVETTNSACTVQDNDIMYAFADGIRVTNDLTPSGDPFPTGNHVITGNTVRYCNRGIAVQGCWASIQGNTSEYNSLYGIWLYNVPPDSTAAATETLISQNKILYNVGAGVALSNTENVTFDGTNEIAYNGYLNGTIPPNRDAPAASLVSVAASTLTSGTGYAVSFGWQATVLGAGGEMAVATGPQGLPALLVPTAADQGIQFTVTLPSGVDGVMVSCTAQSLYTSGAIADYPIPSSSWEDMAYLLGQQMLGSVAADGTISYFSTNNTSGLEATVNSDGSLTITVTAPSASGSTFQYQLAAGIFFDNDTGGVADITVGADDIHDNGYAGIWGPGGGNISGTTLVNHTGVGFWRGGWGAQGATGLTISGSYYGFWAPENGPGATLSGLTISNCTQGIHADGGGQGYTLENSTISDCAIGLFIANQSVATGYPWTLTGVTFSAVPTPVDLDGNPASDLVDGGGNTGLVVSDVG